MTSASGSSNESRTRWGSRYSIVVKLPRRFLVSSISAPMCWLGVTICTRTQGSEMVSISPAPGSSAGVSTTSSALPSRSLTRYSTEGAEAVGLDWGLEPLLDDLHVEQAEEAAAEAEAERDRTLRLEADRGVVEVEL